MLNPLNLLTTQFPNSIAVNAPIEKVFDYLATFQRYQEWEKLRFSEGQTLIFRNFLLGPLGANTVFEAEGTHTVPAEGVQYGIHPGGYRLSIRREMAEVAPYERIVLKTDSRIVVLNRSRSSTTIKLAPTSTGCRITITNRDVHTRGRVVAMALLFLLVVPVLTIIRPFEWWVGGRPNMRRLEEHVEVYRWESG